MWNEPTKKDVNKKKPNEDQKVHSGVKYKE